MPGYRIKTVTQWRVVEVKGKLYNNLTLICGHVSITNFRLNKYYNKGISKARCYGCVVMDGN